MVKVKEVIDRTGRFAKRPFYQAEDLDIACEQIIVRFLRSRYGKAEFPVSTDDLTRLVERDVSSLDIYADLSEFGSDVEGVTCFNPGSKPEVLISAKLTEDDCRENRLRTTLTHEYGHVHFHAYLFELQNQTRTEEKIVCKRDGMVNANEIDWMEWQAGYVCGAILMPKSYLTKCVQSFCQQNELILPIKLADREANDLIDLVASKFQVSRDAAKIRLIKLKHLVD
jgi:IrrE N-terminal-like domain